MPESLTYFGAEADDKIVSRLEEKCKDYASFLEEWGHAERIRKSMAYNAGGTIDSGHVTWKINRGGEEGEVLLNAENHYRSIGQSLVNLTCAQRPSVDTIPKNSTKQALSRAAVGKALVDDYLGEKGLEQLLKAAVERAVFGAEGFIFEDWDAKGGGVKGRVVDGEPDPMTGMPGEPQIVRMPIGDMRFRLFDIFSVVRDFHAESFKECQWFILRSWMNKFDLAARYPELAEKLITTGAGVDNGNSLFEHHKDNKDLVPVWEFYHERTPAVPSGRYVKFCKGQWLEGGPLPYQKVPLSRVVPSELLGTPFGYTPMFDLLGCQETVNGIDTSITTNQLGRGIGNVLTPRNANISVERFATSMNAIAYDGELEPKPLAMPPTPPEFFAYKKDKITAMETISGIGSVQRGTPSPEVGADASGSKLALLDAKASQQNDGLEKTYVQMVREVALNIIRIFRDFAGSEERLLRIVGKYNSYQIKEFLPSDLEDVEDITVDIGNPITRQISGRMALGDRLVELGLIKPENASGYINLIKHGALDPMIQGQQAGQLRIEEENELLMSGEGQHRALITDPHWDEIPKHLELLDNPDLRLPGAEMLQQRILEAVQEHVNLFRACPPEMVLMRGGDRALAIWQSMQMLPQGEQAAMTPQESPGMGKKSSMQNEGKKESMPAPPTQPQQPKNPQTGQRVSVPGVTDGA